MTLVVYDTNMVVSLLSPTDSLHQSAMSVAQSWEARAARTAVSTITWAELRVGTLRRGPAAEQALNAFRQAAIDEIVPAGIEVADIAAALRAKDLSLRLPDALVIATGLHVQADAVLTADKRLLKVAPDLIQLVTL